MKMETFLCLWGSRKAPRRKLHGQRGELQEDTMRRRWHPTQYSCLENPMDGGAWWATVHGVTKIWTRLSNFTFTFHFHALEKEMATYSSVLAWRTPGMGEPGGLPSTGLHRVVQLKRLSSSSSSACDC